MICERGRRARRRRDDAADLLVSGLAAGPDDSPVDRALAEVTFGGMLRRTRRRAAERL